MRTTKEIKEFKTDLNPLVSMFFFFCFVWMFVGTLTGRIQTLNRILFGADWFDFLLQLQTMLKVSATNYEYVKYIAVKIHCCCLMALNQSNIFVFCCEQSTTTTYTQSMFISNVIYTVCISISDNITLDSNNYSNIQGHRFHLN